MSKSTEIAELVTYIKKLAQQKRWTRALASFGAVSTTSESTRALAPAVPPIATQIGEQNWVAGLLLLNHVAHRIGVEDTRIMLAPTVDAFVDIYLRRRASEEATSLPPSFHQYQVFQFFRPILSKQAAAELYHTYVPQMTWQKSIEYYQEYVVPPSAPSSSAQPTTLDTLGLLENLQTHQQQRLLHDLAQSRVKTQAPLLPLNLCDKGASILLGTAIEARSRASPFFNSLFQRFQEEGLVGPHCLKTIARDLVDEGRWEEALWTVQRCPVKELRSIILDINETIHPAWTTEQSLKMYHLMRQGSTARGQDSSTAASLDEDEIRTMLLLPQSQQAQEALKVLKCIEQQDSSEVLAPRVARALSLAMASFKMSCWTEALTIVRSLSAFPGSFRSYLLASSVRAMATSQKAIPHSAAILTAAHMTHLPDPDINESLLIQASASQGFWNQALKLAFRCVQGKRLTDVATEVIASHRAAVPDRTLQACASMFEKERLARLLATSDWQRALSLEQTSVTKLPQDSAALRYSTSMPVQVADRLRKHAPQYRVQFLSSDPMYDAAKAFSRGQPISFEIACAILGKWTKELPTEASQVWQNALRMLLHCTKGGGGKGVREKELDVHLLHVLHKCASTDPTVHGIDVVADTLVAKNAELWQSPKSLATVVALYGHLHKWTKAFEAFSRHVNQQRNHGMDRPLFGSLLAAVQDWEVALKLSMRHDAKFDEGSCRRLAELVGPEKRASAVFPYFLDNKGRDGFELGNCFDWMEPLLEEGDWKTATQIRKALVAKQWRESPANRLLCQHVTLDDQGAKAKKMLHSNPKKFAQHWHHVIARCGRPPHNNIPLGLELYQCFKQTRGFEGFPRSTASSALVEMCIDACPKSSGWAGVLQALSHIDKDIKLVDSTNERCFAVLGEHGRWEEALALTQRLSAVGR